MISAYIPLGHFFNACAKLLQASAWENVQNQSSDIVKIVHVVPLQDFVQLHVAGSNHLVTKRHTNIGLTGVIKEALMLSFLLIPGKTLALASFFCMQRCTTSLRLLDA